MGIPAADLRRVFERFHRGRNVVGAVPGTGIGLAGVRRIVAQHGGTIAVESVEGTGSTFTVRLPVGPVEEHAGEATALQAASEHLRPRDGINAPVARRRPM